jgi:glycosyltransferase involved in cell wall biosynthesis
MKVALISSKFLPEYAGSGYRAHTTYQRLRKRFDIEYRFIVNSIEFQDNATYEHEGIEITRIARRFEPPRWPGLAGKAIKHVFSLITFLYQGKLTLRELRKTRFDIIHTFGSSVSVHVAMYYARLKGIPLMREICNQATPPQTVLPFRLHQVLPFHYDRKSIVVSISRAITDNCVSSGVRRERIWERPNPVDEARFHFTKERRNELRKRLTSFSDFDFVILNIGKFRQSKNQIFLLDVLRELPSRFKLLLCGPLVTDGPLFEKDNTYYQSIVDRVSELGLEDRVLIRQAFIRNVEDYYQLSDVFAFPTLDEALGTPMLECIACGIPVVANRIAGVTDMWIKPGVNGFLSDVDACNFADYIQKSIRIPTDTLHDASDEILSAAGSKVIDRAYISKMTELAAARRSAANLELRIKN